MSAKDLLIKLGISSEEIEAIEKDPAKLDEVATSYTSKFENSTKERFKSAWEKEHGEQYQKNASIGVYNKIEPEIAKTFGLNYDDYKTVDKDRLKKMLADAKAAQEAKFQEIEQKAAQGKDLNVLQLQKQLDELQGDYKRLKELEEQLPTKLEEARREVKKEKEIEVAIQSALNAVSSKTVDLVSVDVIATLLSKQVALDVIFDEKGKARLQILDPETGTLAKRSNTENYTDLAQFIEEKILQPNKWLKMQKDGNGNAPQSNNKPQSQNQDNLKYVHPRFKEAYGLK